MNTKKLLSIAIIAILPFGANADYNYYVVNRPATVEPNGDVTVGPAAPYVTADIEDDDSEHIASTAYVKGAYNDTIVAINKLNAQVIGIPSLYLHDNEDEPTIADTVLPNINDVSADNELVSGMAVKNAITGVNNTIAAKRVTIYTTWEDDSASATTQVELSTAQ